MNELSKKPCPYTASDKSGERSGGLILEKAYFSTGMLDSAVCGPGPDPVADCARDPTVGCAGEPAADCAAEPDVDCAAEPGFDCSAEADECALNPTVDSVGGSMLVMELSGKSTAPNAERR